MNSFLNELNDLNTSKMPKEFENEMKSIIIRSAEKTASNIMNKLKEKVKSDSIKVVNGKKNVDCSEKIPISRHISSSSISNEFDYYLKCNINDKIKEKYQINYKYSDGEYMLSYHILKDQSIEKTIDRFFVSKEYAKFDIDKNHYTDLFFNTLKHKLTTNSIEYSIILSICEDNYRNRTEIIKKQIDITKDIFHIIEEVDGNFRNPLYYKIIIRANVTF